MVAPCSPCRGRVRCWSAPPRPLPRRSGARDGERRGDPYLLGVLKHYFPRWRKFAEGDLIDSFAGLRVLPSGPDMPSIVRARHSWCSTASNGRGCYPSTAANSPPGERCPREPSRRSRAPCQNVHRSRVPISCASTGYNAATMRSAFWWAWLPCPPWYYSLPTYSSSDKRGPLDHRRTPVWHSVQPSLLLASSPLAQAAPIDRVSQYQCPDTSVTTDSSRLRLPESMAAPGETTVTDQLAYFRPERGTGRVRTQGLVLPCLDRLERHTAAGHSQTAPAALLFRCQV